MADPFLAHSLVKLRDEINAEWPNRDKRSDGWIGDAAHQTRVSDHNPDSRGMVHAIDVDNNGVDVDLIVNTCISDSRINYVIWNRRIWSRVRNFRPIKYTGASPHTEHIHISILHTNSAETSTTDWFDEMPSAADIAKEVWDADVIPDDTDPKNPTWKASSELKHIKAVTDEILSLLKEKK